MERGSWPLRITAGLWLCLAAGTVWADGAFFAKRGDVREPAQKAAILHSQGVEDLIIQVQYDGAADEFAWLVPLPSRPEVSAVDASLFDELREYVYERSGVRVYTHYLTGGYRAGSFGGAPPPRDEVTVFDRRRVGVYDVAILGSESVDALVAWCMGHGYHVPDGAPPVLQSYVDRGWIFTAMRIHPDELGEKNAGDLHEGTIQAMRFTFPSDEAVYPLRISSINRGATDVLVYTLAGDTLVHPAFLQRHAAPLQEFRLHRVALAAKEPGNRAEKFARHFEAERYSYRRVAPGELPATGKALPRWKQSPLYLTALQQTFQPDEMAYDVVFKAPEALTPEEQRQWVWTHFNRDSAVVDPLLLRIPESLTAVIGQDLDRYAAVRRGVHLEETLEMLVLLEGEDAGAVLEKAACHATPPVAELLARALGRSWFRTVFITASHDRVLERESCVREHDRYVTDPAVGWTCHYGMEALPGVPSDTLERAAIALFLRDEPGADAAKILAALGTESAIATLIQTARGELDERESGGLHSRRTMALMALRHLKRPELSNVYRHVFKASRERLNEQDIACCLIGLWNSPPPDLDFLIQQIEAHCQKAGMPLGAAIARDLLVNRLRTRTPHIADRMPLDELERELGGKGVILRRLVANGDEVVLYRWGAGEATVKGGLLVKWKGAAP